MSGRFSNTVVMVTGGGAGIKGDVAVLRFSSEAASFVTGQPLAVDGGFIAS